MRGGAWCWVQEVGAMACAGTCAPSLLSHADTCRFSYRSWEKHITAPEDTEDAYASSLAIKGGMHPGSVHGMHELGRGTGEKSGIG